MSERKWVNVESSNLDAIAYDEKSKELFVRFSNSSVYKYKEVPMPVYEQLLAAESKGRSLNTLVKAKYAYERTV